MLEEACEVCGGKVVEKTIDQAFHIKDRRVIISDLPAEVCTQCGYSIVSADVGENLDKFISNLDQTQELKTLQVPIYQYRTI